MKVGDQLFADFGCTVSLTPGQRYEILAVRDDGIGVIDDLGRPHLFPTDHISKHFVVPKYHNV
jgi:hypothetical protein